MLFAKFGQVFNALLISLREPALLSYLYQIFTPLFFAAPACFYLYINGFINQRKGLKKLEWLHFIPALLALIHVIPWPHLAPLNWELISLQLTENGFHSLTERSGLFPPAFHQLFRPLVTLGYLMLTWFSVVRNKASLSKASNSQIKYWVFFLLSIVSVFQFMRLVPLLLKTEGIVVGSTTLLTITCGLLISILLYTLHRPHMFYGFLLVSIDWNRKNSEYQLVEETKPSDNKLEEISFTNLTDGKIKPQAIDVPSSALEQQLVDLPKEMAQQQKRANLNVQQISLYIMLMKDVMENEKLYLIPELQIIDLATKINIPVHHCSYVLNNHIGKNFRDWINAYRVDYFLKQYPLLGDKITIEAIAQGAGFKNQATFYNAFKKEKGMMPTAYLSKMTSI
ncbi:helix-turn-helix domain-containing protein [Pedobacter sandarakinus]|uniref:helix-turn-helix domain-containing protein n=1 Tax=Pedobacter sandarakinus TaxID=353156 RepID=UPI002245A83B|nr:helix-turn-helix domain-containing protein [Pedobacter sandarakinus]MCX2575898.1 helix-turn-helix domain-containing protein [Pedobacter sandarakinus]